MRVLRFFLFLSGLTAIVLSLPGCGKGTGEIQGKVTYQGKVVASGSVMVIGSDQLPKYGPIQPDGSYHVKDVPAGEAKLTVTSPNPDAQRMAEASGRGGGKFKGNP